MVILKSCLMGLLAMLIAGVVSVVAIVTILVVKSQQSRGDYMMGWDPVSMFRHSVIPWLFLTAAFVVGFLWEFRRTVR
jgi:hypothetical protein